MRIKYLPAFPMRISLLALFLLAPILHAATPPNIVLVLIDDVGYGDFSCLGNPLIQTPHIDAFSKESVRLANFHVSPTCAPTRAALLTGRHEFHNGVTHTLGERERLRPDATTPADVLRSAGYTTGIFGKWHLGDEAATNPRSAASMKSLSTAAAVSARLIPEAAAMLPEILTSIPPSCTTASLKRHTAFARMSFLSEATRWIDAQRQTCAACWRSDAGNGTIPTFDPKAVPRVVDSVFSLASEAKILHPCDRRGGGGRDSFAGRRNLCGIAAGRWQDARMKFSARLWQRFPLAGMPRFLQVSVLSARGFVHDDGGSWAAAIAYYSLLSLFPLLLAAGSVAAFFVDPAWAVHKATGYLGDLLPGGPGAIERIVMHTIHDGKESGLLFLVPLLWTGTLVFNAVTKALNVAFESEERYTFWKRTLVRLLMLLTLGGMFLFAMAASPALRIVHAKIGILPGGREIFFPVLVTVLPGIFMLLAFCLSYRFVPRRRPHWRAAMAGAGVAALLFAAAKPLFLGYVQEMASYNVVYGSLAGIIVVILWIWVVAMIGLFGGQVAAHTQTIFIKGLPAEEVAQRHLHRARSG